LLAFGADVGCSIGGKGAEVVVVGQPMVASEQCQQKGRESSYGWKKRAERGRSLIGSRAIQTCVACEARNVNPLVSIQDKFRLVS
jgi:hypothetical protein